MCSEWYLVGNGDWFFWKYVPYYLFKILWLQAYFKCILRNAEKNNNKSIIMVGLRWCVINYFFLLIFLQEGLMICEMSSLSLPPIRAATATLSSLVCVTVEPVSTLPVFYSLIQWTFIEQQHIPGPVFRVGVYTVENKTKLLSSWTSFPIAGLTHSTLLHSSPYLPFPRS